MCIKPLSFFSYEPDPFEPYLAVYSAKARLQETLTKQCIQAAQEDAPVLIKEISARSKKIHHLLQSGTIEDWEKKAEELGILGWTSKKVFEEHSSFYQAFVRWTNTQEDPNGLRRRVFPLRNRKDTLAQSYSIEDWEKKAEELGILGWTSKKVFEKHSYFYRTFVKWTNTQEDPKGLRRRVFPYKVRNRKDTLAQSYSIEDWERKAEELGVLGWTPKRVMEEHSSFYHAFVKWTNTQKDPSEVRREIFTYSEERKVHQVHPILQELKEKLCPRDGLYAKRQERKKWLSTYEMTNRAREMWRRPKGWYTLMGELFPEDEMLQRMNEALQDREHFIAFLKERKFIRALEKHLRQEQPSPIAFMGMDLHEILFTLDILHVIPFPSHSVQGYMERILDILKD